MLIKILELYPEYDKVLGPYTRKDGRKHIILNNSKISKGTKGKTKTISYPKALMEVKLGRKLLSYETVDHIDDDCTNDKYCNLQILSRKENAIKAMLTGSSKNVWKNLVNKYGEEGAKDMVTKQILSVASKGGAGNKGVPKSEEHKRKISESLRSRNPTGRGNRLKNDSV